MTKTDQIKQYCTKLYLSALSTNFDDLVAEAEKKQLSYLDLVKNMMEIELNHRKHKEMEKRKKMARLPLQYNLELYDHTVDNGLSKKQLNQLRELKWLEQNYNIILMGPSGIGKTFIAAGLCFDAIEMGYLAYFKTMEELIKVLKMKDITRTAAAEYNRIRKAHLLVIDDIMMFPMSKEEAVALFNLINELHQKTSLVITTNKAPKEWAEILQDTVLTTALLDRILYRCEIIKLEGNSYRMQNRKTIF